MPTFDGVNKIITLDSGVTSVEVADIYSAWKQWLVNSPDNTKYLPAFRTIGGDPLSAVINAGAYYFLRNDYGWRVKPPEEDITIYLTGNLAVEDTALPALLPTTGAFTAAVLGLQPVTQGVTDEMRVQLQQVSFNDVITMSQSGYAQTASGFNEFGDLIGTVSAPVNNFADAKNIANDRGLTKIKILGDFAFISGDDLDGWTIVGQGIGRSNVTFAAGCSTSDSTLQMMSVSGTVDGAISFHKCAVGNLSGIGCTTNDMLWTETQLNGDIILRADNNVPIHIVNCRSGVEVTTPSIDLNGTATLMDIRDYIGDLELKGNNGLGSTVSIDLEGHIVVGATNTVGAFTVRGRGKKTITGTSAIDSANFLQTSLIESLIQRGTYTGKGGVGVTIAPTTGTDSIEYPYGTPQDPVKTEQNLFDFDSQVFFYRNIYVDESITLTQDHSGDAHNWYGKDPASTVITLQAGCDLSGAQFFDANVTGQVTNLGSGFAILRECIVGNLTKFNGFLYKSSLYGTITPNGNLNIEDCFISSAQPDQTLTIDFQGQAITIIVGDWAAGRIKPINMAAGSFFGASGTGGRVITDASNTGGTIVYAGALDVDDTHAANLDALNNSTVAGAVWTTANGADALSKIQTQDKILKNKTVTDPVAGTITVYDDDDVTPLFTANIWENVAGTTPYVGNAINRRDKLA